MSDAYLDLVMGAQALRREVEREAVDLFGALGIAAWRLPHQIANVTRVLTAPRVRHLLADEVGLGKTVQALMILNALRLQSRGALRALVVVPDALVAQWRDELLSRGHEAPARDGEEPADEEDQRAARLAWPGRMVASEIDPSRYDLLIVDELHALRVDIQARIVRQAPLFSHVLILTATPPFHEPARLVDLLRVLEPARVAAAEALDPDPERMIERLRRQEREVARLVLAGGGDREAWAEHGGPPPPETMASSAAIACCVLRGVVRARRADWPELLPTRALRVVEVEPTEAEVERLALIWRYFTYLPEMTREFDLDLLAQRALRGVASLAQRVTYLRGHGHEREGLLAQVAPLLDRRLGDSRLDGLCDLLAEIWEAEPDARILVVAGDNLTADDLAERLPELLGRVGPAEARVEVKPVKVRNQAKALDSDSDPEHEIESAVTRFRDGQANLLLAAEVGKVGLNLQWTRHLILYSVPWDPQDVEQWLGRVDRIGNPALGLADGELAPIQIYAIAWRGLVDHQILEVIRAAGVLERSVSLDGEAVSRIREAIRVAALSDAPDGWPRLLGQARALARGSELDDEAAPLARWLPWTAEVGMEAYRRLAERRAIEPALGDRRRKDGFEDRERALMGWLYAAEKARVYRLGGLPAPRGARTLGYPEIAAGVGGARVSVSDLPHPQGALKDHLPRLSARASFLARRRDLTSPPVREVVDGGEKRHYLHFLDHGSHLHDELVQTWLHVAAQGEEIFKLQLLSQHPAGPLRNRWVRLRIARWSPSALLPGSSADDDPLVAAARMADERFLAQHAPARLLVHGATVSEAGAEPISTELALALLRPQVDERGQWPWCEPAARPAWASRSLIEQADAALDRQAQALVEAELAAAWPALSQAIEERQHLLAVEGHALLAAPARPPTGELRAALARETDVNRLRRAWLRGVTLEAEGARAVHVARSALIRLS